jgi:hypothetical protein
VGAMAARATYTDCGGSHCFLMEQLAYVGNQL